MSLDISQAIEMEDSDEGIQQDLLTIHMWDAFMELDAEDKTEEFQQSKANEINFGEENIKIAHEDKMGNASGDMSATSAPMSLSEGLHSSLNIDEKEDWAAQFFEEVVVPIGEGQDSFTPHGTSSNDAVVPSTNLMAYVDDKNSFSDMLAPEHFDQPMITDEEVQEALRLAEETYNEVNNSVQTNGDLSPLPEGYIDFFGSSTPSQLAAPTGEIQNSVQQIKQPTPLLKKNLSLKSLEETAITDEDFNEALRTLGCLLPDHLPKDEQRLSPKSIRLDDDYRKYLPSKTPARNIRGSVQEVEQPMHQVELSSPEIENPAIQVEETHQVNVAVQLEQTVQHVKSNHQAQLFHSVEQTISPVEVSAQVKETAIPAKKAVPQLHMAMPKQHNHDFQYDTTNAQSKAKRALKVIETDAKSTQTTTLQCEPESMDGVLANKLDEDSYIVPEEQSEHGLAGLFGLTLDQAKSGMRNRKAGVRNTMIEKPKPAATPTLLQYAGVKKSKSPKVKLSTSPIDVQNEKKKAYQKSTALDGKQPNDKTETAKPVKPNLPPFVTAEQFAAIKEAAKAKSFPYYLQALQEGVQNVQQEALKQRASRATTQLSGQQVPCTSPDQPAQLNPYHTQQQALHNVQVKNTDQTAYNSRQQLPEGAIDHAASLPGNHTATNDLQQQAALLTPHRSPMQGDQTSSYNTPQGAYKIPYYSFVQGVPGAFHPSPQFTPPVAPQASSYGLPIKTPQVVGHQSPNADQMAAFNHSQQCSQISVSPDTQQVWQFAQQGHQVQPQVYYPPLQRPQQPGKYYAPIPVPQFNGYAPRYDPQNQAQFVAQQYRMQQDQMQRQQMQQSGIQYKPTIQDNLNYSAKVVAQAKAGNSKRQFTVEDFLNDKRH